MNQLIKKALSITLLASLVNTIKGDDILPGENTYAAVLNRWTINLPEVTYDNPTNEFTMTYSNTNTNGNGVNDRSMGIPFGGNGKGGDEPYQINGPGDFLPNFNFQIDKSEIAINPLIYAFVTEELQSDAANDYDLDDIGFGIMRMMVRSSLGFEDQPTGGYYEVNFIETIIKIKYKLTAGVFTVASIQVKPRIQRTGDEIPLVAEAYYCDPTVMESRTNPTRERPEAITTYNPGESNSINQGQLLTICISPDDQTYRDGYYLKEIQNFDWNHQVDTTVEQEAIENNQPSTNALTLYRPVICDGAEWCYFQTMLKAPFYYTPGTVRGSGEVLFQYGPNEENQDRRLEGTEVDEILRRLQDNAGSPSNVNVEVFVGGNDQGPGKLRTSGGSSFGIYTVTVITGILVAHLLK